MYFTTPLTSASLHEHNRKKGVFMLRKLSLLLIGVAVLSALPIFAQEVSAGITGRVTDPSGASIVGATVTAKDLDRGVEFPTKTNEDGIYAFPRIPIGKYQLKVEAQGF